MLEDCETTKNLGANGQTCTYECVDPEQIPVATNITRAIVLKHICVLQEDGSVDWDSPWGTRPIKCVSNRFWMQSTMSLLNLDLISFMQQERDLHPMRMLQQQADLEKIVAENPTTVETTTTKAVTLAETTVPEIITTQESTTTEAITTSTATTTTTTSTTTTEVPTTTELQIIETSEEPKFITESDSQIFESVLDFPAQAENGFTELEEPSSRGKKKKQALAEQQEQERLEAEKKQKLEQERLEQERIAAEKEKQRQEKLKQQQELAAQQQALQQAKEEAAAAAIIKANEIAEIKQNLESWGKQRNVLCNMQLLEPTNGKIICPNEQKTADKNIFAAVNDICSMQCNPGFENENLGEAASDSVTCGFVELDNGRFQGQWSTEKRLICFRTPSSGAVSFPNISGGAPIPIVDDSHLADDFIATTQLPIIEIPKKMTGAYFPAYVTDKNLPKNFINLNRDFSDRDYDNIAKNDLISGHNIILPPGKCIVCNQKTTNLECLSEKTLCTLRDNETCFTEVRVGRSEVYISRGCRQRPACQRERESALRYEPSNPSKMSSSLKRPENSCRHVGLKVAHGITKIGGAGEINSEHVNEGQKCISCHRYAFSAPYF